MLYCPGSRQHLLSALGVTLACHAFNVFLVVKVPLSIIDVFSKSMTWLLQNIHNFRLDSSIFFPPLTILPLANITKWNSSIPLFLLMMMILHWLPICPPEQYVTRVQGWCSGESTRLSPMWTVNCKLHHRRKVQQRRSSTRSNLKHTKAPVETTIGSMCDLGAQLTARWN